MSYFGPIADIAALFDHLVGATLQRLRHGNAERLGGLEIDDQFDFRGLHDREIGRLLALKNFPGIDTEQNSVSSLHSSLGRRRRRTGETGRLGATTRQGIFEMNVSCVKWFL